MATTFGTAGREVVDLFEAKATEVGLRLDGDVLAQPTRRDTASKPDKQPCWQTGSAEFRHRAHARLSPNRPSNVFY